MALGIMVWVILWAAPLSVRAQGIVAQTFRAAEAVARGEAQGLSVADGKVVPMECAGETIAPDDSDLQVLLPFEEQREINVIYSKFVPITPNVANPLDEAMLADPERIESVSGRRGQAFAFSGGRLYATLPRLSVSEVLDRGCTLFAWIRPENAVESQTLTVCSVNRHWHLLHLGMREAKLEAVFRFGNQRVTVTSGSALKAGEWQLVVAVLDPFRKEVRLYLDGRREGAQPFTMPEEKANSCVQFLAAGYTTTDRDSFRGAMDDAGMLTRPLSDAQVADLFAGRARRGSFVSAPLPLRGEFNTVRLEVKESRPGTAQVFIRQNDAWHRVRAGEELICDMPGRMPLTELRYKVLLAGDTALESVGFEFENRAYAPEKNQFSFLFLGDMHLGPMPRVIRWAYEKYPDIKLITCPGDVAGVEVFDASYRAAWLDNPRSLPGLFPWFMAPGNHDIEYPRFVNYMVKRQ
ncbi:MAG: metallophosphoesterase, partial [Lentisphaerae bacterium]|nr:metallophosphoesterase [Lentisphaerota bacterium]